MRASAKRSDRQHRGASERDRGPGYRAALSWLGPAQVREDKIVMGFFGDELGID